MSPPYHPPIVRTSGPPAVSRRIRADFGRGGLALHLCDFGRARCCSCATSVGERSCATSVGEPAS
eukprot:11021647-Alexandrium_andersonii.AAC.1